MHVCVCAGDETCLKGEAERTGGIGGKKGGMFLKELTAQWFTAIPLVFADLTRRQVGGAGDKNIWPLYRLKFWICMLVKTLDCM